MTNIEKVLVVGAGTMGQQIALQCALFGVEAVIYDLDDATIRNGIDRMTRMGKRLVRDGHIDAARLEDALVLVSGDASLPRAAEGADLVSESVPENLDIKREVWAEIGAATASDTILTTNTSTLRPSDFADATGAPERFLAWHFHLPAFTANIVDVMPHPGTAAEYVTTVTEFSRAVGQIPIVIRKEHPEYVFNTMLVAFLNAALRLAADNIASIEDIDRSWMAIMGTPQGPFGIMDMVGIDTVAHASKEAQRAAPGHPVVEKIVALLDAKLEAGEVGMKAGKGFYRYPNPAFANPGFLGGDAAADAPDSNPLNSVSDPESDA
jgi:3-hydroxybutyryl-CoA dehydrogenase